MNERILLAFDQNCVGEDRQLFNCPWNHPQYSRTYTRTTNLHTCYFVYHLLAIPAEQRTRDLKTNDGLNKKLTEQQAHISALKDDRDAKQQRVLDLTRLLLPPEIKPQQKEYLVEELKKVGSRPILIKYLREPTSRAFAFAGELRKCLNQHLGMSASFRRKKTRPLIKVSQFGASPVKEALPQT